MAHERSFRNAVKWACVLQGSGQGLNALLTFVFAAILGPKDFGLVAMAMAYILFAKMFLEQGVVPALMQRKDLNADHLDSAFYLNLGLSLVLVTMSVALSRWRAGLNHAPLLTPIIAVLSLTIPLAVAPCCVETI
jgi:O-antigen/teichoic acid export membrane protein